MKRLLTALVMVMLFAGSAFAISYESITVADTAIGITSTLIPSSVEACSRWGDMSATCTLETAQVRYRVDGTSPTSSEGHILNSGDILYIKSCIEMYKFRAIRTGSTSGVLKCTYQ